MRNYQQVIKRIRSQSFSEPNELAREVAAALAGLSRQPGFDRGLKDGIIAGVQGGTTLDVGDPSAANLSDYLVQNPQPGYPAKFGGIQTRRQSRIEYEVRELPGIVLEDAQAGATDLLVKIAGLRPVKGTDPITGVEIVGDSWEDLVDAQTDPDDVEGEEYTATVTGMPYVGEGVEGFVPPTAGQTVPVTISRQWEVVTTWTRRSKKWVPQVTRTLKNTSVTVTNGMAFVLS